MLTNVGLYSYASACLAYGMLTAFLLATRRDRPLAMELVLASALTTAWAGAIAGSTLLEYPQVKLMQLTEVARNAAWSYVLLKLLAARVQGTTHVLGSNRWVKWFGIGFAVVLAALFLSPWLARTLSLAPDLYWDVAFAAWLAMAVLGLLLLEQILRNSNEQERWSSKFLCLGLGFMFAYDFFMYAEALLFRQLDQNLWQSRGVVIALATIFVTLAMERSRKATTFQVSRHVVFHSLTLLAAGVYLILMATVGYFIRYLGGSWSGVLQITFLSASGLLLLALMFSGQIRARTRVWLSKNFFSYKYDYRVEWLQFTQILAAAGGNIPENIIQALAKLTNSPAGLLWRKTEDDRYVIAANWQMNEPDNKNGVGPLAQWLQQSEWIIDLQEWQREPAIYSQLELPATILDTPRAWLIIPLMFGERLEGILLLHESELQRDLNWEDRDLLKVAGRQAASHLAQYQVSQALMESRQFEAFNRLSAYVIHDLKNILAQQSLIVSNAEKHRENPAFIDDVLHTVENSVARMTRLMEQMRSGERGPNRQQVPLCALLQEAVASRQLTVPLPVLEPCRQLLQVEADREQLLTVFTHLIQNAQEATHKDGQVQVRLLAEDGRAVIEIQDDGAGMDPEFVKERLFKPFDSTKGLTGMGIGAFESREFVRGLGGDIQVTSSPGSGSLFRVVLPCSADDTEFLIEEEVIV
jgi:putative PEP-CTERM system histidine kinase